MRHFTILFVSAILLASCSTVKRSQKHVARGNYDKSIELAVKKLQKNKTSKEAIEHIALLEDAFARAVEEDRRQIRFLRKENSREGKREIYYKYVNLEARQALIRPLLPLHNQKTNSPAKFKMVDYSDRLLRAKDSFLESLYEEAQEYIANGNTKQDFRNAHAALTELVGIQSNYKDAQNLRQQAHFLGTDFVLIRLNNHSGQVIPTPLQRELLDFNTYGLDDFWTEYHSTQNRDIQYDYGIDLNFQTIEITPERIMEKEFARTKRISNGFEDMKDRRGNVVRDSLGKTVRVERFLDVSATITITTQEKNVLVGGMVVYRDLQRQQQINSFPLATEFVFENTFATHKGDTRALDNNDLSLIKNKFIPFPSNEQMVFDAGHDIKEHLKSILRKNRLH